VPTAFLEITTELLLEFCRGAIPGAPRYFTVKANGLPEDVEVVGAIPTDVSNRNITLALKSKSFKEGQRLLSPILETVYG